MEVQTGMRKPEPLRSPTVLKGEGVGAGGGARSVTASARLRDRRSSMDSKQAICAGGLYAWLSASISCGQNAALTGGSTHVV